MSNISGKWNIKIGLIFSAGMAVLSFQNCAKTGYIIPGEDPANLTAAGDIIPPDDYDNPQDPNGGLGSPGTTAPPPTIAETPPTILVTPTTIFVTPTPTPTPTTPYNPPTTIPKVKPPCDHKHHGKDCDHKHHGKDCDHKDHDEDNDKDDNEDYQKVCSQIYKGLKQTDIGMIVKDGQNVLSIRGNQIIIGSRIGMIKDVAGRTIVFGKDDKSTIREVQDVHGKLIICGMDVQLLKNVSGKVIIVQGNVGDVSNLKGRLSIIDGKISGQIENTNGRIDVDGVRLPNR